MIMMLCVGGGGGGGGIERQSGWVRERESARGVPVRERERDV